MNTTSKTILSSTLLIAFLAGSSASADAGNELSGFIYFTPTSESATSKKSDHRSSAISDNQIKTLKVNFKPSTKRSSLKDDGQGR